MRCSGPESADVIILNTCGVKGPTENRIISRIRELRGLGKKFIIAGCLPSINRKRLEKELDGCEYCLLGPDSICEIGGVFGGKSKGRKRLEFEPRKPIGIIPISSGCMGSCNYCAVKQARGSLHSYSLEDILCLAKKMVNSGIKEIRLTAQDTGCYGLDIGLRLTDLLDKILTIEGEYKIRIGMMNPHYALEMLGKLKKIYRDTHILSFAHIPVQSGSNRVLREMGREYTIEDFVKAVKGLREVRGISISTDIIVGFPTETNSDFEETVKLIRKIKPEVLNLSKFCPRPGTAAAGMKQLPTQVIKERSRIVTALYGDIRKKKEKLYKPDM